MSYAVIFDVDGTLWDSREQVIEGWNQTKIDLVGYPLQADFEEASSWFGRPMNELTRLLFPEFDEEKAADYGKQCFDGELVYLRTHPGIVFDGIREMLSDLAKDHPLYIVSNCQCGYIEILLESSGLSEFFSGHLCFEDTYLPKSGTIRQLMQQHGIEHAVYVGDTQGDCDACRDAEVPFVFVEYGFGSVSANCPHAKTVADIPQIVRSITQAAK